MYAPAHICKALWRIHPWLRFAWAGKPTVGEELNPGSFAVVQLYHIQDAGKPDEEATYKKFWHVENHLDETNDLRCGRIDRGPIFNKDGGTTARS